MPRSRPKKKRKRPKRKRLKGKRLKRKPKAESPTKSEKEQLRLEELTLYERKARSEGYGRIGGVDEAGRGPLAGPVVAAACIVPHDIHIEGIDDSKKLSATKRLALYRYLTTEKRIRYGIGVVSPEEIDRINIYQATIVAMLKAVEQLPERPDCLLVDGMQLNHPEIFCQKIVGGDGKSQSIAAASNIAKVSRDLLMQEYAEKWPQYRFEKHKGYGTREHLEAIRTYGPCPIHRLSFAPLKP